MEESSVATLPARCFVPVSFCLYSMMCVAVGTDFLSRLGQPFSKASQASQPFSNIS